MTESPGTCPVTTVLPNRKISILYEDNHLLVVEKPVNLLNQADESGDPDLPSLLKSDLKKRYGKPGNVYLGLVHRLDSLNAFVACPVFSEPHHACHPQASHPHGLLLVCERCHGVTELPPPGWVAQLQADAVGVGFQVTAHELEIKGLCRACREKEAA